jgi:hypothetical protein
MGGKKESWMQICTFLPLRGCGMVKVCVSKGRFILCITIVELYGSFCEAANIRINCFQVRRDSSMAHTQKSDKNNVEEGKARRGGGGRRTQRKQKPTHLLCGSLFSFLWCVFLAPSLCLSVCEWHLFVLLWRFVSFYLWIWTKAILAICLRPYIRTNVRMYPQRPYVRIYTRIYEVYIHTHHAHLHTNMVCVFVFRMEIKEQHITSMGVNQNIRLDR